MEEASCPLPALEAAFRDGREFLAEPLRSKRVWAAQPGLRSPRGLRRSWCAKDRSGALEAASWSPSLRADR